MNLAFHLWKQKTYESRLDSKWNISIEMYLIWQYYFEMIIELQVLKARVQADLLNTTLDYQGKGAQNWYLA